MERKEFNCRIIGCIVESDATWDGRKILFTSPELFKIKASAYDVKCYDAVVLSSLFVVVAETTQLHKTILDFHFSH